MNTSSLFLASCSPHRHVFAGKAHAVFPDRCLSCVAPVPFEDLVEGTYNVIIRCRYEACEPTPHSTRVIGEDYDTNLFTSQDPGGPDPPRSPFGGMNGLGRSVLASLSALEILRLPHSDI